MAAMFIFTILMNLFAWAAFTVTDIVFGGYSFVNMIVLAEWFVMPMAASAIYRAVTSHKGNDEQHDKAMYMLMWFVVSTGISGLVCRIREMTIWYDLSKFNSFDYPSFASFFVLGFIVYSLIYDIIGFFVDGHFASHKTAGLSARH
ncbi:hypothetical protein [uncultured Ruminococcus sp.]|uniref:hypothetical protein n=1 Tax=uncultured Ruminococcus sp. TaxID=165186 RepID=UPI0025E12E83|nr:hypothetical protein [uncultured Ruminococcus sp.]